MAYLEIWKSRPAWHRLKTPERTRLVDELSRLVSAHVQDRRGQRGPFLDCKPDWCVLVWETHADHEGPLNDGYARIGLDRYFERLICGPFGDLSAKDYLDNLSK